MPRKRRSLVVGGALAAAIAALFALRRSDDRAVASAPAAAVVTPPGAPPSFTTVDQPETPGKDRRPSTDEVARFAPDPALATGGSGSRFEQYGFRSGRLAPDLRPEGADPVTRVRSVRGAPALTVWVDASSVRVGGRATVRATLERERHEPVDAELTVQVTSLAGPAFERRATMRPAQRDDEWTFELDVDEAAFARLASGEVPPAELDVKVVARGAHAGERFTRAAATMLFVQSPGASWRRDALALGRSGSDLALDVAADVRRGGTYWMYAELWGGPDARTPVAFAMDRFTDVAAGTLRKTLLFGGGIIRDSGVDGPYVVRNVRLNQVDTLPPHEATPIGELPPSAPWSAHEFQ